MGDRADLGGGQPADDRGPGAGLAHVEPGREQRRVEARAVRRVDEHARVGFQPRRLPW